jgi:hypothetical protein
MKLAELLNERKSFKEEIELPRSPERLRDEVSNISPPSRGGNYLGTPMQSIEEFFD